MKFTHIIFLFVIAVCFSQNILVDDAPMCGLHSRHTYAALWDTLEVSGCTVSYTSSLGRYPDLSTFDAVILLHHSTCSDAGFSDEQRFQIIEYVCSGGNIVTMPIGFSGHSDFNSLFNDPRWDTGLNYGGIVRVGRTSVISSFSPYTDDVSYLDFGLSLSILTNFPAFPFIWTNDGIDAIVAISYPTSTAMPCSCEAGGRIIALPDNYAFQAPLSIFLDRMNYRFISNVLISLSGSSGELPHCDLPPGTPFANIDTCANPGEILQIFGENLYPPVSIIIDTLEIFPTFLPDSSMLEFTVPDLPQADYQVFFNTGHHLQGIGRLSVFCDKLRILTFSAGCFNIGDTVIFTGSNIEPDAELSLVTPDQLDTVFISDFEIFGSDSGWFIIPSGVDTALYSWQLLQIENISLGNSFSTYLEIPCPCPDTQDEYRLASSSYKPADTRKPTITPEFPDTCIFITSTGYEISYSTIIDSFMAVPGYWSGRYPAFPIDVEISTDGGTNWDYYINNGQNTGSFVYMPRQTSNINFRISACDSFGNSDTSTFEICFRELTFPPLTGYLRSITECEPDSFMFILRNRTIIDPTTLNIRFDSDVFYYPDSMSWLNDSTLVFYPEKPFDDSYEHWVRLDENLCTTAGIPIEPDTPNALEAIFNTMSLMVPESDTFICFNNSVTLDAGENFDEYLWYNGSTEQTITLEPDTIDIQAWVTVINDFCIQTDTFMIFRYDCEESCMITIDAISEIDSVCFGDSVILSTHVENNFGSVSYEWIPSDFLSSVNSPNPVCTPEHSTSYIVVAIDRIGCIAQDTIHIVAFECDQAYCDAHPKPFTPNNDAINDYVKFEYPNMYENRGTVYIYNLEGQLVIELKNGDVNLMTSDGTILWDGKDSNGRLMENGPYLYVLQVEGRTMCNGTIYIAR